NAHIVQEHITAPTVRVIPDKADYLVLDDTAGCFVSHVIFHEPEEKGKGLTLVPTTDGKLLVGPSEQPGDGIESFSTTRRGLDSLRDLCSEVVPSLDLSQTIRSFGALRPNPFFVSFENGEWKAEERSINNFTITSPLPGFFSLIGIKTPGLTCANELGGYIASQVAEHLAPIELNHDFNPVRNAPISVRHLSFEERAKLGKNNPAYAKIICRCGDVTEGEVIDAIRCGAATIDAVKRRVGTGLGRCQGSFCTDKIMKLIERESGLSPYEITKCGLDSEILGGCNNGIL
ncbi:MAG: FAD-dependent oxidoreductase, partial [Oscillospiraceae bacterium]|nr:FAD-dependent oxidoreductase [Oscillospiraceae bacterium]